MDWGGDGGAYGYSFHFGTTMVPKEQAKPPQVPQEAHRFQCLLVLPPPFCHRLCAFHHSWILPIP